MLAKQPSTHEAPRVTTQYHSQPFIYVTKETGGGRGTERSVKRGSRLMAASIMSSLALKPAPASLERLQVKGIPSLVGRPSSSSPFKVQASGKKLKTDKPYGINGGMNLSNGLDASGRKQKGKGVYQFVDKYGANVDGYRYFSLSSSRSSTQMTGLPVATSTSEASERQTGLLIWAVTLAGILAGGALLVYNTSALSQ
ncbi:hypothetical protein ZIOFF_023259 [Zingiber officinale]|uniref:Photosystem II 10 kDa polypeptide, chloroplastic n=1 Tax=Zingiber officinale TaxID=94328 RepID=A0A8J5L9S9_ZINOF|nr:hypothetical protein ZIOFF_023259 [Zingiber officinale]